MGIGTPGPGLQFIGRQQVKLVFQRSDFLYDSQQSYKFMSLIALSPSPRRTALGQQIRVFRRVSIERPQQVIESLLPKHLA